MTIKRKVHIHKEGTKVACGLKVGGGIKTATFISCNVTCNACLIAIGYPPKNKGKK